MELLSFPHPLLFKPCRKVSVFGPELKTLLNLMWDAMNALKGIGLAANQVGLSYAMFVMAGPDEEHLFIVNPRILRKSTVPANLREGCLSAPGEFLVLSERASWVEIAFQDESGTEKVRVFQGLHAVCVQHEMDHLVGKSHLQSSTIPKVKRKELAKKWGLKFK